MDHGGAGSLGPYAQLFDGGGPEGVGGADIDFLAGLGELGGQFADGGGFADAVDADDHDDQRESLAFFGHKALIVSFVALFEQGGDLFAQDAIQLGGVHVFIAGHPLFDTFDDADGGVDPDVGGDENLFEIIEHFVVHFRFAGHGAGQFGKDPFFGFLQAFVEVFLVFFFRKEIEQSHDRVFLMCQR